MFPREFLKWHIHNWDSSVCRQRCSAALALKLWNRKAPSLLSPEVREIFVPRLASWCVPRVNSFDCDVALRATATLHGMCEIIIITIIITNSKKKYQLSNVYEMVRSAGSGVDGQKQLVHSRAEYRATTLPQSIQIWLLLLQSRLEQLQTVQWSPFQLGFSCINHSHNSTNKLVYICTRGA